MDGWAYLVARCVLQLSLFGLAANASGYALASVTHQFDVGFNAALEELTVFQDYPEPGRDSSWVASENVRV